mmetsp:Transcript_20520/g.37382  ORF Transcript_20520/g.37382 Transcript_20520/m.37382 type:complete len:889 (-) Transcript_20520:246-2912(-)|eukprot:CAMPEP_0196138404 /NCGR_PEP_ID=MMETSP0910-20130528/6056_1 /TAXON_ID=49265 /ORGANISM="Thalassiosira rotula, Strain GSO102" /LENGTH=888 /DNA_ID=CAMNT_0041399007 /DNA_START=165 /DNA_END=2831 /DNA_ORIENTATION=+
MMSHHARNPNDIKPDIGSYVMTHPLEHGESSSCSSESVSETSDADNRTADLFTVNLTPIFVIKTLLFVAAIAFSIGTACRTFILNSLLPPYHVPASASMAEIGTPLTNQIQLPSPTVESGKDVPLTSFTSKLFMQKATITSNMIHLDRHSSHVSEVQLNASDVEEDNIDEDEDDLHLPAGQHLLVDIKHVDPHFLNSEVRLAEAMIELTKASKLTLLSYHCHTLIPSGVSCAGVLLESHVAFHTWPTKGVIAMDLFTCGAAPLIPILPLIKRLFAIPSNDMIVGEPDEAHTEPTMLWSHKLRGFRQDFSANYKAHEDPLDQDLGDFLSVHDFGMKIPLVSEKTDFQHVDIFEVMNSRLHSAAPNERSSESLHPDLQTPDKILYLDGVEQSTSRGEAAYHEALVHPSMIAHPNPKRVAIIGGGEGATLREVLKHNTVEHVMMVEIDEELVEICDEFMPEWSDCSDIAGSDADSCFNDSRAAVEFEDAFKWFIDRFEDDESTEEKFDVIIMDALDPDQLVEIVGSLYKNNVFIESLANALTEDGVFVVQLGESEAVDDPPDEIGTAIDTAHMMGALEKNFESMHEYDEGHSHFKAPWSYLVCFKNSESRANWYRNAPEIQIDIHQRLYGTKSGEPVLLFFDAPTMISYQVPPKAKETTYCRKEDKPQECNELIGIDPKLVTVPISHAETRKSTLGEFSGRGLFASQDIPKGASLDVEGSVKSFHVLPSTYSIIYKQYDGESEFASKEVSSLVAFVEGYGFAARLWGKEHYTVDSSITTFCNHGCNGTYNLGDETDEITEITEMNIDLDNIPEFFFGKANVYSPVFERHLRQMSAMEVYARRDIRKGEEILCNYLAFDADQDSLKVEITNLRSQCAGETMGQIAEYESWTE